VEDLQRRGVVTFLMRHGAASHFLYRGEQMGFEYELAQGFAKDLGVELEIITPPPGDDLSEWLKAGKGDIVAGLVTTSADNLPSLSFSVSSLTTDAQVITRSVDENVRDVGDLAGKVIAVQADALHALQFLIPTQPPTLAPIFLSAQNSDDMSEVVRTMESGQAAAVLVTTPIADLLHKVFPGKLRTAWISPQPAQLRWAVRPGQSDLLLAINSYLERASRSGLRKILFEKYFVKAEYLRGASRVQESTLLTKRLSRYDHLIARHAEEAGFDWRLVAALIFEESRFDHKRVSEAGAYGLMQIMPMTAQDVGIKNYTAPRGNIAAGVKYLQILARQFPYGRADDRLALILASYLLGPGHVEDAQRLAQRLGYDPHCWTESMERVLPLLEETDYHNQTLHGPAAGSHAVRYVNAIRKRYFLYSRYIARELTPAASQTSVLPQAASAAG
jgi:membrane-bound lytic murein transglycosylase F